MSICARFNLIDFAYCNGGICITSRKLLRKPEALILDKLASSPTDNWRTHIFVHMIHRLRYLLYLSSMLQKLLQRSRLVITNQTKIQFVENRIPQYRPFHRIIQGV